MKSLMRGLAILGAAAVLGGCATASDPHDPFEGYNRAMMKFNDKLDEVALKPAAKAYQKTLPSFAQTGIGNFFSNLGDVWTGANNFMQGNVADGSSDIMRFLVNSTIGFLGLLDIATEAGMPKHYQNFGTTLGVWGVGPGPYLVLPFFGPSTVRDTAGLPLDWWYGDPWQYTTPIWARNTGTVVRTVDQRAAALGATNLLEDIALDRYIFIRDSYLQRRESKIKGNNGSTDGQSGTEEDGDINHDSTMIKP